jgi:hypothetical protein
MNPKKIVLPGLTATSLMTLFSYAVSEYKAKNFKEPQLLAGLLKDALPAKELALLAGWATHYSMGITWASVFQFLFERTTTKPNFKNGLLLGGLSGLTAIVIWRLAFKIHPDPPRTHYKRFYAHLFLAHLVYSSAVTTISRDTRS